MRTPRLAFLLIITLIGFGACSQKKTSPEFAATTEIFAILQGATHGTATEIIVLADAEQKVRLELSQGHELGKAKIDAPIITKNASSPKATFRFLVSRLSPGNKYELTIRDEAGNALDRRFFRTLDLKKKKVRFAMASCMDDNFVSEQAEMWQVLAETNPDVLFLLGDNVYGDWRKGEKLGPSVDPDVLWARHVETRSTLALFRLPTLIPTFSVWDDHDYGMNDGDRTYPFRAQALEIHTAFFGSKSLPPIVRPGPGAASLVRGFGQTFIFLDDRSFRSKNLTPEICRKLPSHSACKGKEFVIDREETHFGDEQERWLFTQLRASKGPIWLASGDQWFGAYHPFESFAGNHPKAFESFLRRLRPLGKKVLFLSGDRHLSEISRIEPSVLGYETFELTSSPIHARTFPSSWKEIPNPLQVNGIAENFNFLIVDSEAKEQELEARVKAIGLGGKVFFERQINLKK